MTIATAGAAAPLLIPALAFTGIRLGVTGGGLKFGGWFHERKNKKVEKTLKDAIGEDMEANKALKSSLSRLTESLDTIEVHCIIEDPTELRDLKSLIETIETLLSNIRDLIGSTTANDIYSNL